MRAFGDYDNRMALANGIRHSQVSGQCLWIMVDFGNHNGFRATGHQRQISTLAAHHLNEERALMGGRGHL